MFKYDKKLVFPIDIKKKDLKMAKLIVTALGGPAGELAAALRYFSQKFSMPDEKGKSLLNDIATEELGHAEMICTMIHQLISDASIEDIKSAGLESYYVEFGKGVFPVNASGVPFDASYFSSTSDPVANLAEDMAAEQKARASYEKLLDLATDEELIKPLLFLRQREIIHYHRFKELFEEYTKKYY